MAEENTQSTADLIGLTAEIVAAYVGNNPIPTSGLANLIADTHAAIDNLTTGAIPKQKEEKPVPAVPIRKSVTPDFLICLEDGRKFKSLKRHISKAKI